MRTTEMLRTHPTAPDVDPDLLARAIDAAAACAQTCTACADACLGEEMVADLRACIRSNLDCADVCGTTARMLSRHTGGDVDVVRAQLEVCVAASRVCGDRCDEHAGMHEHCSVCAEACRECEQACRDLLAAVG